MTRVLNSNLDAVLLKPFLERPNQGIVLVADGAHDAG